MSEKKIDFYCIGAAHLDIKAKATAKPELGETVLAETTSCFGGVACNIAENLAKMGALVALCSRVGKDEGGSSLIKALSHAGIDTSDISFSPQRATATYYALLNEVGELFIAVADMGIYDEMTPALMASVLPKQTAIAHWIIDSNLSEDCIKAIAKNRTSAQNLWGVGVASCKAERLRAGFPHWQGLFLNQKELASLSGMSDVQAGMRAILELGCPLLVVTVGVDGLYYSDQGHIYHLECPRSEAVDVTGAGDALCAGVLYGLFNNEDIKSALEGGIKMAALMVGSLGSSLLKA